MDKKFNENKKTDEVNNDFLKTEQNQDDQAELHNKPKQRRKKQKLKVKNKKQPAIIFAGICVVACILGSIFYVNKPINHASTLAISSLENQVSASAEVGTLLVCNEMESNDYIAARDFTIKHNNNKKETKVWIWDFADEDGDYAQVYVNGKPVSDIFMLKNKPREITVPSEGEIQIKGVKDGYPHFGVSYGIKFELNNKTFFNVTHPDKFNTFTLTTK